MNWWDGFYVNYDRLVTGEVSKVRENGAVSGVGVLATYGYDNLRRRTSVAFGNGAVQAYSYDPVSRLSQLTNDLSGTANDLTETFAYNPSFQIVSTTRSNDAYAYTAMGNGTTAYTSNGLNQQVSIGGSTATWDSNGNLSSEPQSGKTYTHDIEDRLTASSGGTATSLAYDPLDRLDTYNPGTLRRFVYDGDEAAAELDSTGAIQNRYVRGDPSAGSGQDELLVDYSGSSTTNRRFTSADERGSIISLTDSSGNLVGIDRYDEYGKPQPTNIGRFQYTGQAWLPEANVAYYKARTYLPHLGIFGETDPAGYADSANLYAYVLDDPVNNVDPTGMKTKVVPIPCPAPNICIVATLPPPPPPPEPPQSPSASLTFGGTTVSPRPEPPIVIIGNRHKGNTQAKQNQFTCADALRQRGQIVTNYVGGGVVGAIGWTGAYGHWRNVSTGAHGDFATFGFAAGLAGGASFSTQRWTSLQAFIGSSDSVTVAFSFNFGPFAGGGEFTRAWNEYGSGQGPGVTLSSSGLPRLAIQGAWTDTEISNCRPK